MSFNVSQHLRDAESAAYSQSNETAQPVTYQSAAGINLSEIERSRRMAASAAVQNQNQFGEKKVGLWKDENVRTNRERDELIEELKRIQNANSIPMTRRRDEIRQRLAELDAELGNGEMSYGSDRMADTLTGGAKGWVGEQTTYFGKGAEALNRLGEKLGSNTSDYAGWATDELSAAQIGNENDPAKRAQQLAEAKAMQEKGGKWIDAGSQEIARAQNGLGEVGRTAVEFGANAVQMGLDRVTGPLAMLSLYTRAAGGAMHEAETAGASTLQQHLYGNTIGAIEAATEGMFGGLAKVYGAGSADDLVERVIRKLVTSELGQRALLIAADMGGEGIEEIVSDIASPYAKMLYDGGEALKTKFGSWEGFKDALAEEMHDGLVGALMGGLGAVTKGVSGDYNQATQRMGYTNEAEAALREQWGTEGAGARNARDYAELIGRGATEGLSSREQAQLETKPTAMGVMEDVQKHAYEDYRKTPEGKAAEQEIVGGWIDSIFDDEDLSEDQLKILKDGFEIGTATTTEYAAGVKNAYQLGQQNLTLEQARQNASESGKTLNDVQFEHAWRLGASGNKTGTPITEETFFSRFGEDTEAVKEAYQARADGVELEEYAPAYTAAYNAGMAGVKLEDAMSADTRTAVLSDKELQAAWELGSKADERDTATRMKSVKTGNNLSTVTRGGGTVRTDSGVKFSEMNSAQKTATRVLRFIAKGTGVNVVLFDGTKGGTVTDKAGKKYFTSDNGYFDPQTNTIHIDISAGVNTEEDIGQIGKYTMLRTFSHEYTHFIEHNAADRYRELRTAVFSRMSEKGQNAVDLIERKMSEDSTLTYDGAAREVIADAMSDMLEDSTFAKTLAKENHSLFESIREQLRAFVSRLRAAFQKMNPNEDVGAKALKEEINGRLRYFEDIQKIWDNAALEAARNYAAARESAGDEAAVAAQNRNEGEAQFSKRSEVLALGDKVDWVGDQMGVREQLIKHREELGEMEPVAEVNYRGETGKDLEKLIMEQVPKIGGGLIKRGSVSFAFDEKGANAIDIHTSGDNVLRAAALSAPYVAKKGRLIAGHKNHEGQNVTTLTYAAPVMINGIRTNVGVVIQFSKDGRPKAVNVATDAEDSLKELRKATSGYRRGTGKSQVSGLRTTSSSSGSSIAQPSEDGKTQKSSRVTPKEDQEYEEAYFDGDDETMQELVDRVANRMGYTYKAFHHTENAFTEFDLSKARANMDYQGFFFSADPEAEREYGSVRYDVWLKMDNPYVIDSREKQNAVPFDMSEDNAGVKAREWFKNNGYDSVIRKAEYFGAEADEYVVFDPNQIKSSEPVVYSDDEYGEGDFIPLSERFNQSSNDIRHSRRVPSGQGDAEIVSGDNSIIGASEAVTDVTEAVQHSYRSLAQAAGFTAMRGPDGERYWVSNEERVSKVTEDDIRHSPIGAMIMASVKSGDFPQGITEAEAKKQVQFFTKICNMAATTRDFAMVMKFAGSAAFTAMKANSDVQYGTTYDFPSICTKTQATIDAMSAYMVKHGRGMSRDEILDLYRAVFASGNPVPCPECYVFSRWIGIGGLLDNIKKYQDKYCSMKPADVLAEYRRFEEEINAFAEEHNLSFGKAKGKLAERYEKLRNKIEKAENQGEKVKESDRRLLEELEPQHTTLKAMTWIRDVYFGGDLNAKKMNPSAQVPVDVLFDLNAGDAFATRYPEAWDFRTTQGAGYGKAITPYAESVIGEGIMITNSQKFIDQKKEYARETGEVIDNPFLHPNPDGTLSKKAMAALNNARKKMKAQNFRGGQRYSSTSDARPDTYSDFLLAALETQAMQGMVQVYTKVTGAVDAYNDWGFSTNLSLMPMFGGLDADGYIIDTPVGGMNPRTAATLRGRNELAGTITIGVNDEHIRKMMNDGKTKDRSGNEITVMRDFIIPYHASGGQAETVDLMRQIQEGEKKGAGEKIHSTDYTRTQGDKILSDDALRNVGPELWGRQLTEEDIELIHRRRAARIAILCGKKNVDMEVVRGSRFLSALYDKFNGGEWTGVTNPKSKVEHQIYPNEFWDKSVSYKDSGKITRDYLAYCEELGFLHRFSGRVVNGKAGLSWSSGYDKDGKPVKLTDLAYEVDENGMPTDKINDFFWKVLTDRRMYGADGRYLEQQIANLTVTPTSLMPSTSLKVGEFAKAVDESREYDKGISDRLVEEIRSGENYAAAEAAAQEKKLQHSRRVMSQDKTTLPNGKTVKTLAWLNAQEKSGDVIHTYKSFVQYKPGGPLYAPMATMTKDESGKYKLSHGLELGTWEVSEGNPRNVNTDKLKTDEETGRQYATFQLKKTEEEGGGTVPAAYNPYQHSSNSVLNDQFEAAYRRPNLVTVECIIPASELTSGYWAPYAKDPVGQHEWHKGIVASNLKNTDRQVYMSRWLKPVRILSNAEVAQKYAEIVNREDEEIQIPFSVVSPELLTELERIGVPIDYEGSPAYRYHRAKKIPAEIASTFEDTARQRLISRGEVSKKTGQPTKKALEEETKSVRDEWMLDNWGPAYISSGEAGIPGHLNADNGTEIQHQRRTKTHSDLEVLELAADRVDTIDPAAKNALQIFKKNLNVVKGLQKQREELIEQYAEMDPNSDEARKILNRRKTLDGKLNREKNRLLEMKQKPILRRILKQAREVVERDQRAQDQEKLEEYRTQRNESDSVKKYRARVQKKADALYEMLMTNSDKKHVPDALKVPVAEFLESIDFSSKRKLRGGEETKADQELGLRMRALERALSGQQSYAEGTQSPEEAARQPDLGGLVDISQENLQFLRNTIEMIDLAMKESRGFTVNSMSGEQLKLLSNFLSNLNTAIRNLNNFMANARFESVREAANKDIEELKKLGKADEKATSGARRLLMWENGTPFYVFRRFGEGGRSIFDGFTKGWEKLAFNAQEIINFTSNLYTDKEVNEWKSDVKEITLWDGSKLRMTTAQIMELSMLLNREQARKHIEKGGIRIGDIQTKNGTAHDTAHYHLTMDDVTRITGMLTDRQLAVAKALQNYMAVKGAEWGNEISMRRFGYRFYTEGENYYPIRTDSNDRPMADTDAQMSSMFRLLNLSSSKSLNPKASNALVVGNIFDTFADHMSDMAKLNGMGLPILDAIKWFNYKEKIDRGDGTYDTRTMQGAIEEAYGSKALSYFRTLVKDINGMTESGDRGTNPMGKLLSNYKIAAVGANLRVALLQPTSYVRAMTVLKPQFMVGVKPSVQAYREAMKYSGTAVWKALGYYDTDIAKGLRGQIEHDDTWKDKIAEASMTLAEKGDQLTWSMLWTACKKQTAATTGKSGEELMQATADLFREVIYSSQVMDSTLTRSEIMRGKTMWSKMNSAFMAEPTLSYNILLDAYSEYQNDVRRHGKAGAWQRNSSKIGKALAVYASSAAFAAIVESIADAARDDDDEKYIDKVLEALLGEKNLLQGNLAQDLTIIGKVPFLKNFISTLQGYSSGDMSATAFNNALNAVNIWVETARLNIGFLPEAWKLDKPTKTTYYGKMTPWGKVYKTLQATSQLSGVAASNFTRDATAIWNTIVNGTHDDWKIKTYDGGTVSGAKADAWKENLKPMGISKRQYGDMLTKMDVDESGSLKQGEVGFWLNEQLQAGAITREQAEAIWKTTGPSWKKTYGEWSKTKPVNSSAGSAQAANEDYTRFKNSAPIYGSAKRDAAYSAKPAGMSLDRYIQILQAADTDANGSLKQDELGYMLRNAAQNGEMTWGDAARIWASQDWERDFSSWMSKHP